ncbi:hypothetical protein TNCV_5080801 [Trichonephila clavipes]|nr:hypothetical protein TNCV_5080801 [Trichonephila clavipes]
MLQRASQEKLRDLHAEQTFNGLFNFRVASKAPSCDIFFKDGNRRKSLGARSGLYGGYCRHSQPRVAIWFCIAVAECGLALSSNNRTSDLRSPGHFFSESICLIAVDLYPIVYR